MDWHIMPIRCRSWKKKWRKPLNKNRIVILSNSEESSATDIADEQDEEDASFLSMTKKR